MNESISIEKLEQVIAIIEKALNNVDFGTTTLTAPEHKSDNFDDVPQEFDQPDFAKFYEPVTISEGIESSDIEIGSILFIDTKSNKLDKLEFGRAGVWRDGTKVKVKSIIDKDNIEVIFPNGSPASVDVNFLRLIQEPDINEMSSSGGAGSYDTAQAFSKSSEEYNRTKKKFEQNGYTITGPSKDIRKRSMSVPMEMTNKGTKPLGEEITTKKELIRLIEEILGEDKRSKFLADSATEIAAELSIRLSKYI